MIDFLTFRLCSQLLTALIGCGLLFRKRTFFMKLLTIMLVLAFLTELVGTYLAKAGKISFWVYHVYTFFEFFIIFFMYKNLIKDKKYIKISYVLLTLFFVSWIMVYVRMEYFYQAIVLGSLNVGVLIFLYLRELLLSNKIINYKKLLPFWVSVGFLVFYLPSIPFFSFWSYLRTRELMPILNSLIILMNIIISFGLIWSNKKVEY